MSILIALIVFLGLGYAARSTRGYGLISTHTYNNRYNDAAGAREDHLA
jgi:hypothetical protein